MGSEIFYFNPKSFDRVSLYVDFIECFVNFSSGVGLHWVSEFDERQRKKLRNTDDDVNASILANLQQLQDEEFNTMLAGLTSKVANKLFSEFISYCRERQ